MSNTELAIVPMSILYASSQVGLVLYMFLIGVEFDTNLIRQRLRTVATEHRMLLLNKSGSLM